MDPMTTNDCFHVSTTKIFTLDMPSFSIGSNVYATRISKCCFFVGKGAVLELETLTYLIVSGRGSCTAIACL
jgi:hypothetical protein